MKDRLSKKAELLVRENIEAIEAVAEALKHFHSLELLECGYVVQAIDKGQDWRVVFQRD